MLITSCLTISALITETVANVPEGLLSCSEVKHTLFAMLAPCQGQCDFNQANHSLHNYFPALFRSPTSLYFDFIFESLQINCHAIFTFQKEKQHCSGLNRPFGLPEKLFFFFFVIISTLRESSQMQFLETCMFSSRDEHACLVFEKNYSEHEFKLKLLVGSV